MVTIRKNDTTLNVTRGAFNSLYKAMGFSIVNDAEEGHSAPSSVGKVITAPTVKNSVEEDYKAVNDDYFDDDDDLEEKPLSEMTFKELKQYAAALGLDVNGVTSKRELRAIIRESQD